MNNNFSLFSNSQIKQKRFFMNNNYPDFCEFEKMQEQFLAELDEPLQSKKRVEKQTEFATRVINAIGLILADPNVRVNANELFLLLYGDFVKMYKHHFQAKPKSVKSRKKPSPQEEG